MVYVALYSYVQPYRQLYANVLETIILTNIILLLTSAPFADYKVINFSTTYEKINFESTCRILYLLMIKVLVLINVGKSLQ